jgi:hypothetical protein
MGSNSFKSALLSYLCLISFDSIKIHKTQNTLHTPNKIPEPIELHDIQKTTLKKSRTTKQQNALTHPSLTQHHVIEAFIGHKSASYDYSQITFW